MVPAFLPSTVSLCRFAMSAIPSSFEHFVMFRRAFIATRGPQEENARLIHRVGYLGGCFEITVSPECFQPILASTAPGGQKGGGARRQRAGTSDHRKLRSLEPWTRVSPGPGNSPQQRSTNELMRVPSPRDNWVHTHKPFLRV